jgi:hypothetical protein
MKEREFEKQLSDAELDAVLNELADDVPPMPADFHRQWTEAIRKEPAREESAPDEKAAGPRPSVVLWTRILSVAAVFVFLIGGTILYRNSRQSLMDPVPAGKVAGKVETMDSLQADAADEISDAAAENGLAPEESVEAEADLAMEWAPKAREDAAEMPMMTALKAAGPEAAANMPEPRPVSEETPAEETEEAEEISVPEGAERNRGNSFMADMAEFLRAALPYLLVLAVPAVTALLLRRKKSGKN